MHNRSMPKTAATIAAKRRRRMVLLRNIVAAPGYAECSEREDHQTWRRQLERELSDADYKHRCCQRPAKSPRKPRFGCVRMRATASRSHDPTADADCGEKQRVSRQSGLGGDLEVIVVN